MTFFEKTMRQMFGDSDILTDQKFSDKTMLAKLDDDLRVKVSFTTLGYADHYEALRICIINRTEGEVDSQVFQFDAVLGGKQISQPYGYLLLLSHNNALPMFDSFFFHCLS